MTPTIAIIGALDKEVRSIYAEIEDGTVEKDAGLDIYAGKYCGFNLVATVAGMGTVNAGAATQYLITRFGASTVIFSGIAGGLNLALHIDDVVIGKCLRYIDTDTALIAESTPNLEEYASSDFLVDIAEEALLAHGYVNAQPLDELNEQSSPEATPKRYLRGTIATGDRFITGEAARSAVVGATHADCAEMEGAAVAHIAAKNGADCLVLRAISDNCDEAYDAFCEREFDLEEYARNASMLTMDIVRRLSQKMGLSKPE